MRAANSSRPDVRVTRRGLLATAAFAGAAVAAGCAPAAADRSQAPAVQSGGVAMPQTAWDELVAAAKQEGRLSLVTVAGVGYRKWGQAFQDAFPGIEVEQQQFATTALWVPKVLQERQGGLFLADVVQSGAPVIFGGLKGPGALAPLRPLLLNRPDVLSDSNWQDGFDVGWQDEAKQLGYGYATKIIPLALNTDLVQPGEVTSIDDVLNPKGKGKLIWGDVSGGGTFGPMHAIRVLRGEDAVKRLIVDQQPLFSRDARQLAESMIRGQYAIASALTRSVMQEFWDQGLGKNVQLVDLVGAGTIATSDCLWFLDRAPHPNAAKLFVNWALTKEGQTAFARDVQTDSRRTDVTPLNPDDTPKSGRQYVSVTNEASIPDVDKTRNLLDELVRSR